MLDRLQPHPCLQVTDLGIISDDEAGLERALQKAVDGELDILMTSGRCWLQSKTCTQPPTGAQPLQLTTAAFRAGFVLRPAEACKHLKVCSLPAVSAHHVDSPQECVRLTLLKLRSNNALGRAVLSAVV